MITYLKGDATSPQAPGPKIIAHICNDIGGWGKGFVLAISKKWPTPEQAYRDWYAKKTNQKFALGEVQFVKINDHLTISNMVAQHGVKTGSKGPPIRYDALNTCLNTLGQQATKQKATIHMPRIGCGLAGGKWEMVLPLITKNLCSRKINTYIYDY